MSNDFHVNHREETLISRLENSRQSAWGRQLMQLDDCRHDLASRITMHLIENNLIETNSQKEIVEQLLLCFNQLLQAEDFEIQYAIAPIRTLVEQPNRIALYTTAFIGEKLIKHKAVIDIFGTDEDIYNTVQQEVAKLIN
ncbi:MAG: hypothetical protein LBJ14_11065 [Desulfarculales bacterium]|nr:hypothetical protein [Desulfarculales bacterium]